MPHIIPSYSNPLDHANPPAQGRMKKNRGRELTPQKSTLLKMVHSFFLVTFAQFLSDKPRHHAAHLCSLIIASRALCTATLSSKSTPWYVGGTVGFLAWKEADSGVGILAGVGASLERKRRRAWVERELWWWWWI